jgi:hypothetical protein
MALRGYLLARLASDLDRDGVIRLVRHLEKLDEVTFAEPLIGAYDLMVRVESATPLEEMADRLADTPGVCEVCALKVNPIPARDRMWHNLEAIPLSRES